MDMPQGSSRSSSGPASVPAPLDGEIILPKGRGPADGAGPARPAPRVEEKVAAKRRDGGNLLIGVTIAALFGLGAAGGFYFWDRAHALDAAVLSLRQVQHEVVSLKGGVETLKTSTDLSKQDDTIRSLKKTVEALKAELETTRAAATAANAQLAARIDKTDHDPSAKLADLTSRLDKLENPSAKLGELTARLDRIERQVSSPTPTGSITPAHAASPPVAQTVSAPAAAEKAPVKPTPIGAWVLRDVYDGIALVEGRSGGIREVTPGEFLPGAGEVRAIERHGRNWIVVTSRGFIDDSTF